MRRASRNAGNRQTFKRLLIMFWLALAAFAGQGQAKHCPPALDLKAEALRATWREGRARDRPGGAEGRRQSRSAAL